MDTVKDETYGDHCQLEELHEPHSWSNEHGTWMCMGTYTREKKMDTKKARRRSFDVEYVVVTEDNIEEVAKWCGSTVGTEPGEGNAKFVKILNDANAKNARQAKAFIGDLVLGYGGSSFKAYTQKAFDRSFEEVVASGGNVTHINQDDPSEHEVARSAQSGQFVTKKYAEEHPDVTVVEAAKAADHTIEGGIKLEGVDWPGDTVLKLNPDQAIRDQIETPTEDLRGL